MKEAKSVFVSGDIRVNVGDTPGIRNYGRVRITLVTPYGALGTCLDANRGDGCAVALTPEQWAEHFVPATPEALARERARAESTPDGRRARDHGDLWWSS